MTPTEAEWLVAFTDMPGARQDWWHSFTRPGYRHVVALRLDVVTGHWIVVEWGTTGFNVEILSSLEAHALVGAIRQHGGCLMSVPATRQGRRELWPRLPLLYCVTAVQRIIGLGGIVWTPWQLAGALRRAGAVVMFEPLNAKDVT